MIHRRDILKAAGAGMILLAPGLTLAAAATARRFVFVIQRGAADGLNTVIPYADPAYAAARGPLAITQGIKLDGQFALHPAMPKLAALYAARQALFVHAIASPYRDRSHFDGQNVLETGGARPYAVRDGWMNRLLSQLPDARDAGIALAATVPAALRGSVEVASYAPSALPQAPDDLLARVGQMYAADTQLHPLWDAAMKARGIAGDDQSRRQDPATLGALAASFLARPDGPRVAMIETGGWDTHAGQNARLGAQLGQLDTLIDALRVGLGPAWSQTVVLVATEFGRTVAANGTGGTDHGTASAAMLIGGAVKGGRVIADWPGLSPAALYESRDLRPTAGLDSLIAGAAGEAFAIDPARLSRTLFAQVPGQRPLVGLLA